MVNYSSLSEKLIEAIPELRLPYEQERRWWGDEKPGPHVVFGDILTPYLISMLQEEGRGDILRRIFGFLEELANDPDVLVQEVVAQSVCERLMDEKKWLKAAQKYMGPRTLQFVQENREFWAAKDEKMT